jgi:tryptophan-rich sensory protein
MKKIWLFLGFPLAVGGLATLLAGGMGSYGSFNQPPLSPPGWVFPVVWTLLYLAMGYSSWRVYTKEENDRQRRLSLGLYLVQLFFNFIWPIIFFRFEAFLVAFGVLIALWIGIVATMWQFYKSDERAGDLLIPYLLWVTFAGYLNLGVYLLNG